MGVQLCDQVRGMFWLQALGPRSSLASAGQATSQKREPCAVYPQELGSVRQQRWVPGGKGREERAKQPSLVTPRADGLWKRFPESRVAPDTQLPRQSHPDTGSTQLLSHLRGGHIPLRGSTRRT